jgi:hypothetical protein
MDEFLTTKLGYWPLALAIFAAFAWACAVAHAETCPVNHTEIRISQKIAPARIDETKEQSQLTNMRFNDAIASDRRFIELTGLTVAGITVDQEMRFASSGPEDGPSCVWPSVVTVTLSTEPIIYVVSTHGQCLLRLGIEHEERHVGVNKTIIETYSTIFRRQLAGMAEAIAAEHSPPTRDPAALRSRMEEKLTAMISVTADTMYAAWRTAQHAVDTPQEYKRISEACPQVNLE